jgi:allene oxide cyclase
MVRKSLAALACAAIGIVVGAATFSAAQPASRTIHVIEHANTDTVVDTGASGDTTGDLLTFHNPVYDSTNAHKVGHDQGECIRISPSLGTWECRWVTYLAGGNVTVEGPFADHHDTTLAVTGGSGGFRTAKGQMALKARNGGTQYDFIFTLYP